MKKILTVFGTRPEAIKMAMVILRLKESGLFQVKVAVTAQHRQMLDQVLDLFKISPEVDLDLMTPDQDLFALSSQVLQGLKGVLVEENPDLVLVQGDTTTTFMAALAAFYLKIPVGHVEAGLRTRDQYRPFPEEMNRRLTGVLADYHFAPTAGARENLLAEGVPREKIWVTGNTVIDALQFVAEEVAAHQKVWENFLLTRHGLSLDDRRLVLVTGHRRENFGPGLENLCLALQDLARSYDDIHIVYPVHLNPQVQRPVKELLAGAAEALAGSRPRISLLPPLAYAPFIYLLQRSYLVLTDSGGLQEEAPALGKPVLVLREVTERPEGVAGQTVELVGTRREAIVQVVKELLDHPARYRARAQVKNPYGDGRAAQRIVSILSELLSQ
jgi:UDP-N-acetylglucosamine 2-epimerase (non-hydrolysing)